jgi:hypothetical protein
MVANSYGICTLAATITNVMGLDTRKKKKKKAAEVVGLYSSKNIYNSRYCSIGKQKQYRCHGHYRNGLSDKTAFKGTVQQKLRWVKSDINR